MSCRIPIFQPLEANGGADAHLQPEEEPTPEQGDAPADGRDSMGKPALEPSVPEGLWPVERTHAGAVREGLQPMGRTYVGEVHGGLSSVGGTPHWSSGKFVPVASGPATGYHWEESGSIFFGPSHEVSGNGFKEDLVHHLPRD